MNARLIALPALGFALLLAGCATPFDVPPGEWLAADLAELASRRPGADRPTPAHPLPPQWSTDAGVDQYVNLALERSPQIKAAAAKVRRLAARVPQVTALDDPMLQVAPVGEMAQTAAGEVGLMTTISQRLPLPQKLDARGRIAVREVAAALAEYEQTRLDVMADVRRAYWRWYAAVRGVEVIEQSRGLLQQMRDAADASYRAGAAPQQDLLRMNVELSELENQLIAIRQQAASAQAMLTQLLDLSPGTHLPDPQRASQAALSLEVDRLLAQSASANPEIEQRRQLLEQAHEQLRLARLSRWPDLTVGLTYNAVDDEGLSMAANGDDQWWLSFGINLPIWAEKYDAAEAEALRGVGERAAALRAAQNRVAFRVEDAALRVQAQQAMLDVLRNQILPQARQTVEVSTSGYRAGNVGFASLVDNWRQLLRLELMVHQSEAQLHQNLADLEQVVGRDAIEVDHE